MTASTSAEWWFRSCRLRILLLFISFIRIQSFQSKDLLGSRRSYCTEPLKSEKTPHAADIFAIETKGLKPEQVIDADVEKSSQATTRSRRAFLGAAATSVLATATFANEASAHDTEKVPSQTVATSVESVDWKPILQKASKKALGGGKAGAAASIVQVLTLMWLRTTMNYQYRYGGELGDVLNKLWQEGGIPRFYKGVQFALFQGPLTRFGDTAANVGILALLESDPSTQQLPLPLKTACASVVAGLWRIFLMPIDTSKTTMQVEGSEGLQKLLTRVGEQGPSPLYQGALASAAATAAGHFPWFLTYNFLNEQLPIINANEDLFLWLIRSASLGLAASCVSDVCSNSFRVIKTTKQTASVGLEENEKELSYKEVVSLILEKDGVAGLFGRGLQTRLLTNAIQGAVFSVLWKYFQQVGGVS